jgi:hypothetical protein
MPDSVYADVKLILSQIKTYIDNQDSVLSESTATSLSSLSTQIAALQTLTSSNDLDLDTVQEIVEFIKTTRDSLNTILVNDLTTGGIGKALTAEQGKVLKALIDAVNTAAAELTARVVILENKVSTLESEQVLIKQEAVNLKDAFSRLAAENPALFPQS